MINQEKIKGRVIALILCMALALPMMFVNVAYADSVQTEIQSDYMRQYAAALYSDKQLVCDNDKVDLSTDDTSGSLVISGEKDEVLASKFEITKTLNFDGNAVDRFSFDATAKKGEKAEVAFYLDDNEKPFITENLYKQKKKNTWEFSKEFTKNIADLKLTGNHKLSFKILSSNEDKTAVSINYFEFVEGSIPVVYLNIDESEGSIAAMNSDSSHDTECYGNMDIVVPEGYKSVDSGDKLKGGSYEMEYIRGRGNSTWDPDKKPYKIKLDKKSNLLGLGKNKHWVLLANYYDNSLLRNRITYWLANYMGMSYVPQSEPVDVVMNGEYLGNYFLCEQVRVGENRVEIDDLEDTPNATTEPEITGGYLLSMFPYGDEGDKKSFTTDDELEFLIESPALGESKNEAQYNYIKDYVQKVENALNGDGFNDKEGISYKDLMDVHSTAQYYWMQEFSLNGDGYGSTSTYLYKPRGDKLYWGPVWDFDYVAWGSTEYDDPQTSGWTHNTSAWNSRLLEDPKYVEELVNVWNKELKPALDELIKKDGVLDKYAQNMTVSARYNFEKWGFSFFNDDDYSAYYKDTGTEEPKEESGPLTYEQEIGRLREWINNRTLWVDKNVDSFTPVETMVTFMTYDGKPYKTYKGYVGRTIKTIPDAPERKGYVFTGWEYSYHFDSVEELLESQGTSVEEFTELLKAWGFTEEEIQETMNELESVLSGSEEVDKDTAIVKDMVITPCYIKESEVKKVKKIYFDQKKYYSVAYEDGNNFTIQAQVVPFDATFTDVTWSSSDTNIATVDQGEVNIKEPGDVVITASTRNGVSASCEVHIYSENEDYPDESMGNVQKEMKLKKGAYGQLHFDNEDAESIKYSNDNLMILDDSIAEVGSANVVHALKAGTTYIINFGDENTSVCKLSVNDNKLRVGDTATVNGIKYKVTSTTKKSGEVAVSGLTNTKKKAKTIKIPSTVKIKGKKLKVTQINAFSCKNLKKLNKLVFGKNVEIVGKSAFRNCNKLKKVYIKSKQSKIYKSSFRKIGSHAKFYVPKKSYKYYKIVLKSRRVISR